MIGVSEENDDRHQEVQGPQIKSTGACRIVHIGVNSPEEAKGEGRAERVFQEPRYDPDNGIYLHANWVTSIVVIHKEREKR